MSHHRETIKSNLKKNYGDTKERAHDSQIVTELKKTSSCTMVDPAKDKYQAPTNGLNLNFRAVIKSLYVKYIEQINH